MFDIVTQRHLKGDAFDFAYVQRNLFNGFSISAIINQTFQTRHELVMYITYCKYVWNI